MLSFDDTGVLLKDPLFFSRSLNSSWLTKTKPFNLFSQEINRKSSQAINWTYLMQSSSTSSWKTTKVVKFSSEQKIGREALITSSTRELVEFYWTNRKRFSGAYSGFPANTSST